ncbi:MAG: M1 family metallopeptidase [Anaerolineales bacterium]|nr:M1 family metallopeptidase [Anaerolineales bacterium]
MNSFYPSMLAGSRRMLVLGVLALLLVMLASCARLSSPAQEPVPARTASSAAPSVLQAAPRYEIDLAIDFEAHTFRGQQSVDYTNTENVALERLYFRLLPNGGGGYGDGRLEVSRALVAGREVEARLSVEDTVLEVDLPGAMQPGESLRLEFEFNGVVTQDFGQGESAVGYGIYNFSSEVLSLSGWYPILAVYDADGWNLDPVSDIGDSVYSDIAFYTVEASFPDGLTVVATGVEAARQADAQGARARFESGPARDFFLAASPNFQVKSQVVDGVVINSYYLPEHAVGGEKALSVAADSLHIFNQQFGPYPYQELDVVEAPMQHALGVEYPGIFLVSASLYGAPERSEFVVTVAHEAAHQWWYNAVGNDVFDEPWLDEALTTYSSSLYYEFRPGGMLPNGLIEYWQSRRQRLLDEGKDDLVAESLAHFDRLEDPSVYGGVVYNKGALFFYALREEIGDRAFFQALQAYYRAQQYRIASSEALLAAFEEACGCELDAFYQEWLYSKETQ